MQKFGRNYILTISGDNFDTPLVVSLPFTIEFDITRNTLASLNVCQIRLYNLSPDNRNLLRKNVTGYGFPVLNVVLQAGYGTQLPIIFTGNASQAWSVREGVNFVTQIECFDGGFAFVNSQVNLTVPAGTPNQLVVSNMIQSMKPHLKTGSVGSYPGLTPRGITYSGNTVDNLNQLTGFGFFVDNGFGNALGNNEYTLSAPAPVIDASTGLLNTPVREQNIVRFDMIFEPSLSVGTGIQLDSITTNDDNINGFYKITSIKHRGMISQTVCGDAITTAEFVAFSSQDPVAVVNLGT